MDNLQKELKFWFSSKLNHVISCKSLKRAFLLCLLGNAKQEKVNHISALSTISSKSKKRILLISYNFSPELTGIGKYNGEMLIWLMRSGYDCSVVTAYPYYPYWQVQEPYAKYRFKFRVEVVQEPGCKGALTVYRCPLYVPTKPSGLKRIILDLSFFASASIKLIRLLSEKKYDILITVAPSFQVGLLGLMYKKLRKAKLLYHIQDLQIEAARDLQLITSKRLLNTLFSLEKFILNNSDFVSTISEGMIHKVQEKAGKDVFLLPNWTDPQTIFPISDRATLKEEFGFSSSDVIILYSGAIGEKQGLEAILYAAQVLQENRTVKFVISGVGPYKEYLQTLAVTLSLQNIIFLPLQPIEKFNQFLNAADVHLVVQKNSASDLVMPSKLTSILAVGGLAVITANPGSCLHALVEKYDMGILVAADDQQALNEGLLKAVTEDNHYIKMNARFYAQKYLSMDRVMKSFEKEILVHC